MGWWRFDELSGITAKDWSDLQNHGTLHVSAPLHVAGRIGNGLTCNGPTNYVDVPVNGLTFADPSVTLALWTYGDPSLPNVASNFGSIVVSALKPDGTTSLLASIPLSDGSGFFRAGGDSGADTKVTPVLSPGQYKGQWNHWVFARESSRIVQDLRERKCALHGPYFWEHRRLRHDGQICESGQGLRHTINVSIHGSIG